MEISTKPGGLPNFFYDIIVFLIPTLLFGIGLVLGLGWEREIITFFSSGKLEGWQTLWLIIAFLLASYEYGRVAETFSDTLVAAPLRFLHRKKILFRNKDFSRDLCDEAKQLNLKKSAVASRTGSKWTIYVFALIFTPALGIDLIKRYAWEKLARSSAFSCALLALISISFAYFNRASTMNDWQFGGIKYTGVALLSYIVVSIDYYKRNAWNHDLLVTVIPVLASAVASHKADSKFPSSSISE